MKTIQLWTAVAVILAGQVGSVWLLKDRTDLETGLEAYADAASRYVYASADEDSLAEDLSSEEIRLARYIAALVDLSQAEADIDSAENRLAADYEEWLKRRDALEKRTEEHLATR